MTVLEMTSFGGNTLRRLRHQLRIIDPSSVPDLAPAYELDRFGSTPTLVAEDLPAVTLDDLTGISPLPAAAALHALHDVAATLEAMHDNGLVHGHLGATTVLLLPDGRAALTRPGGTEPAPAEDLGPGRRADARDFAILAFELLAGVHPLDPSDAATLTGSLPTLPRAAARVLEVALATEEEKRPLPHALLSALDAIPAEDWPTNGLQRRPPRQQPARLAPPVQPPPAQAPTVQAPADPVADAPVVGAVVATPDDQARPEAVAAEPAPVAAPAVSAPARRSLFRRVLGPFVILLGLATVLTGGAAGAWLLFAPSPSAGDSVATPPLVRRVSLSVTPPQAQCPYAALHVTATIVADGGAGDVELRWRLPDGSTADTESFAVDGGRRVLRAAFDLTLTGRDQLIGEVVAVVNGVRSSVPLRYVCPSAVREQKKEEARAM